MNRAQDDQDLIKDFEERRVWFKASNILLSHWHQWWAKDYGGAATGCVWETLWPLMTLIMSCYFGRGIITSLHVLTWCKSLEKRKRFQRVFLSPQTDQTQKHLGWHPATSTKWCLGEQQHCPRWITHFFKSYLTEIHYTWQMLRQFLKETIGLMYYKGEIMLKKYSLLLLFSLRFKQLRHTSLQGSGLRSKGISGCYPSLCDKFICIYTFFVVTPAYSHVSWCYCAACKHSICWCWWPHSSSTSALVLSEIIGAHRGISIRCSLFVNMNRCRVCVLHQ